MSVETWGTVSDVLTAIAAVIIAGVGGVWAWFRYRREDPDLPRVNSSIALRQVRASDLDYVAWAARIEHVAGSALGLLHDADRAPQVSVSAYPKAAVTGPAARTTLVVESVFPDDTQVAASEYLVNE